MTTSTTISSSIALPVVVFPPSLRRHSMDLARITVLNLGLTALVIASTAMIGHGVHLTHLADWGGEVPMAVPTAVCSLCLGAAVVLIALTERIWQR